jgi:hypothetical protein
MDYNEYIQKQSELDGMKNEIKKSFMDEYQKRKDELAKLEEDYKKLFGESIGDTSRITEEDLKLFIEIIKKNPTIELKDLKAKFNKHPKTILKIKKNWELSDKTLENLKTLLKVA